MPPKVYVTNYPAGDFRAMPALGGGPRAAQVGHVVPGQPGARPADGDRASCSSRTRRRECCEPCFDAGAVTALRTGAAAVLAAETLGRADAATAAVIGAGVNGRACARDVPRPRAGASASGTSTPSAPGARRTSSARRSAASLEEALAADLLVTVTPGHELLLPDGSLAPRAAREPDGRRRPRQGGDRGDRARADARVLRRLGAGESRRRARARRRGRSRRARQTSARLGAVLAGVGEGRRSADEITVFDSTGLAIQDLAIALAALERAPELDLRLLEL